MTEMLYVTSVDVSVPNGPGVNELQFVRSASRVMGTSAKFILPSPKHSLPDDFPTDCVTFLPPYTRSSPISWLLHQFQKRKAIKTSVQTLVPRYVVFRSAILPLAELFVCRTIPPYFLKTAGSGEFQVFDSTRIRRILKPLQRILFGKLLRHSAGVDVVSEIHRHMLGLNFSMIKDRIAVFDNAVDTEDFYPSDARSIRSKIGADGFEFLIGYVGNYADSRGGTELLECWNYIEQREKTGLLVVSGDRRGERELSLRAEQLGVSDRLIFLGPIPMSEVKDYMSILNVGVSFRDDDGSSELKVRQYLACGIPVVVSSRVNSFVDSAGIGISVPRSDVQAIGKAVSDILARRKCADHKQIREYAVASLGYDAMIRARRKHWLDIASGHK